MSTAKEPPRPQRDRPDRNELRRLATALLTAPRTLTPQVLHGLLVHHDVPEGEEAAWLASRLPQFESYELDLLLSPMFTPGVEDRLRFEAVLGEGAIASGEVDDLVEGLLAAGLRLSLRHDDACVEIDLPRVAVERFIRLLHLDAPIPPQALAVIDAPALAVRVELRDRVWRREAASRLLPTLLAAARTLDEPLDESVRFLTDFMRSHRPKTREDCLKLLGELARAYEEDLNRHESGSRPFFDSKLQGAYAGRWSLDDRVREEHMRKISVARRLEAALRA